MGKIVKKGKERVIAMDTPCTLAEVARFVGIGKRTIYDHVQKGYRVQYPRISRTTIAHFLAWASQDKEDDTSDTPDAAARRHQEMLRLRGL